MAVDMSNVKQIMHNNKEVIKIEDSLGHILWQKEPEQPYRRLEYIHFNGNDYINSEYSPWDNFGFYLDIQWDSGQEEQFNGHGKIVSNNRAYIGTESGSGGKVMFGCGEYSGTISNSNVYERHTYQVNTSGGNGGKFYIDGTLVWSGISRFQNSNRRTMLVGGFNRRNSNLALCKAKIYNVRFINSVSNSSTITWNWIPCQRKSDGAIGFYNIRTDGVESSFITSVNGLLEAGPVLEENWDGVTVTDIIHPSPENPQLTAYPNSYLRSYSSVKDTNYIDFGFKWNSQWRIEGYYYRPSGEINYGRILGTGSDKIEEIQIDYPFSGTSGVQRQLIGNSVNNQVSTYTQNTFERYGFACGNRGDHCESWYWTNSQGWNQFGSSWSNSLGLSNYNLRFFSCSQGDRDGIYGIGNMKIMGPDELWNDEGALYLFIPAKNGNTYGMYDTKNNVFYPVTTSGNGRFNITDVNGKVVA